MNYVFLMKALRLQHGAGLLKRIEQFWQKFDKNRLQGFPWMKLLNWIKINSTFNLSAIQQKIVAKDI